MHTLGTHFGKLLQNLTPPDDRLAAARDLPPLVRDYLAEHEEFGTLAPHTRLAGSYAQDLSVGDVKDVDFLVRVDGDPEANDPPARQVIRDLKAALDGLADALGYGGSATIDVAGSRRSVHVHLRDRALHLDAVPCVAPDGFEAVLWVPDRGWNRWVRSHPLGVVALIKEINEAHGRKVRSLGKLLKHVRAYHMRIRRPKSYWLLALLVQEVRAGTLDFDRPLAVLFRDLLAQIHARYASLLARTDGATPNLPDPMLGHNVSWNWGRPAFETFMARLDDGRCWATRALEAEGRDEAIGWWQKVFGEEWFPKEIGDFARSLAADTAPGRSYVTPAGLLLPARPATGAATPVPRTTFHGAADE